MSGADSLSSWRIVEGFGSQPAADPASPHTYIGANIGEWRIRKLLGVGGMGAVYEALRDVPAGEEPGLPVAVKVLSPQLSAEPEIRKRFVREARAQARLDHPNIIPVLDAGEHDDTPYLVMPMFSGGSLKDLLHERKRLPEDEAIDLWVPLLEALDHAHSRGYVHRDIKPDNVMLDNAGQPWLADFGLVGSLGDTYVSTRISAHGGLPKAVSGVGDGQLTYAGEVLGTPAYMSPEQCQGRVIDQRSDLYSFGCLMYHCLCGRPPFVEDNPWAYFMRHLDTVPPSPREVVPDLSDDVVAIIQRLLAKSREERFPTAAEVARVLRDGYLDDVYRMNSKQQRMAARAISGRHGGVARGISDRRPPSLAAGGGSRGRRPGAASRDRSMPPVAVQMEPPPRRAPAPPPTRSNLGALVALAGVLAIGAIVSLIVAVTSQSGNTNAATNTAAGNDTRKPPPLVANTLAEVWPERYTALVTGLADPALGQRFKDLAPERQQIIAALSPELRA
ncbi:MAG: serine/threonine-protein kinase, partial [Planctomycetota bacterium]